MIKRGFLTLVLVIMMQPSEPDIGHGRHATLLERCVNRMNKPVSLICFSFLRRIAGMKQELRAAVGTPILKRQRYADKAR